MTNAVELRGAIARTSDPITSHIAADAFTASGKRLAQAEIILTYVRRHPGLTAGEYGVMTGLGRVAVGKRLPEIRDAGHITQGDHRKCSQDGTQQMTWWPAQVQAALPLA